MNIFLDETILYEHNQRMGFPNGSVGEESAYNGRVTGDVGLIPGSGRSPGEGSGKPLGESLIWLHQI